MGMGLSATAELLVVFGRILMDSTRRPYNLYCVGADVKPCSINQSINDGQHTSGCSVDGTLWCGVSSLV